MLIAALALPVGVQNATARQFGTQELKTTALTTTIVAIGFDSRLAGGTGSRAAVAPVIALAAAVVAVSLSIFRYGPAAPARSAQ